MTFFDDLARDIAKGISRRDVVRRFARGVTGLIIASLGLRRADAAIVCGTCRACDIDNSTCGSCNPGSTAQSLCTAASRNGSYLRLENYLTTRGFVSVGTSDSVFLYSGTQLLASGIETNFLGTGGSTATIRYSATPARDLLVIAIVSNNGTPIYALTVDSNGRVVQTVATQSNSTSASTAHGSGFAHSLGQTSAISRSSDSAKAAAQDPRAISSAFCEGLFDHLCNAVALGGVACGLQGFRYCLKAKNPYAITACTLLSGIVCSFASEGACNAAKSRYCGCAPNQQSCNGVCCDPCQDCLNNTCVPNVVCAQQGLECCDGVCCQAGYICDNGVCTSPNKSCVGATCSTFVPCSTNSDCVCVTVASGGGLCVPGSTACAGLAICNSTPCPPGTLCALGTCCGNSVCIPISLQCPPQTAPSNSTNPSARASVAANGPTIGRR